jgi:hypothetical protein
VHWGWKNAMIFSSHQLLIEKSHCSDLSVFNELSSKPALGRLCLYIVLYRLRDEEGVLPAVYLGNK